MIIVNENADFSGCGIGKVVFKVEDDVNNVLNSCYENLGMTYKLAFQKFINTIGGLNGDIWNSIYELNIPIFAASVKEFYTNVKTQAVRNPGGGTYDTYENYIKLNRGVGANILSGKANVTNFAAVQRDTGLVGGAIIVDGLQNYNSTNVVLGILGSTPTYSHAWQMRCATGVHNTQDLNRNANCYVVNMGESQNDCVGYSDGVKSTNWSVAEGYSIQDAINYEKEQISREYTVLDGQGNYPLISVKLWMTFRGLTAPQIELVNEAITGFYDDLG